MYRLLCLLAGVMLAFVIVINGTLTSFYGAYIATVIIHMVGTVGSYLAMKAANSPGNRKKSLLCGFIAVA